MVAAKGERRCAYCGHPATTDDHVVSRALYPPAKASSRVQRITVPACEVCNGSWKDDEVQFRNIPLVSGEPNEAVRKLWEGKTRRSFGYVDGPRRLRDLLAQMVPVGTATGERHMVYPGRDERVMRVVRKVIRGLSHHHNLLTPVEDSQVWADVQRFEIPPAFLADMTSAHVEEDILNYQFGVINDEEINSFWLLTLYERTPFLGVVFRSLESRARFETGTQELRAG